MTCCCGVQPVQSCALGNDRQNVVTVTYYQEYTKEAIEFTTKSNQSRYVPILHKLARDGTAGGREHGNREANMW